MREISLPNQWIEAALDDVVDNIVGGGTPSKAIPSYFQGNIPWMTVKDMNKFVLDDTVDHISEEAANNSATNIIPAGTPIIATRMSLGKLVRAKFDSAINQDLKAIFLNENISKIYFEYWYRSISQKIQEMGTGTTVKGIRLEDIKQLSFLVAPLAEQQQIAQKLDELLAQVDILKTRLDAIPNILKRFRQSVLAAAVSGRLTEEWRENQVFNIDSEIENIKAQREISFNEISDGQFIKTGKRPRSFDFSTLNEVPPERDIPSEWKLLQMGEIISFLTDYHANGSYEVLKENVELKDSEDYACMIRATNFEKNNFSDLMIYISESAYHFMEKSKLYGGEILIGKIGNAGSVYLMPYLNKPASLAMNLFALRFPEPLINSKYIYFFLKSRFGESNIQSYVRGVATKSIDKISIRSIFINLPPLEEQTEIVRRVEQLFAYADQIEQRVKDAQARVNYLTQSILAKAFRGELTADWRAQNPELISGENSAAALLERIKAERMLSSKKSKAKKG